MKSVRLSVTALVASLVLFLLIAGTVGDSPDRDGFFGALLGATEQWHHSLDVFSAYTAGENKRDAFLLMMLVSPLVILSAYSVISGLLANPYAPHGGRDRLRFVFITGMLGTFTAFCLFAAYFLHGDSIYCRECETGWWVSFALLKWFKFLGVGLLASFTVTSGKIALRQTARA